MRITCSNLSKGISTAVIGRMAHSIVTLSDMIDAFDKEQPKPGRETSAFIMRWKRKELEEKHGSHNHLAEAVRGINRAEIQNIRETKHFRDKQKVLLAEGKKEGGRIGGRTTAKRRMIRDGTFAVESE